MRILRQKASQVWASGGLKEREIQFITVLLSPY